MVKVSSTVILIFLFISVNLTLAHAGQGYVKAYSGYYHNISLKTKRPFWHIFFSSSFPRQEEVLHDRKCIIEFKSPIPFSNQTVTVVPEKLTYLIKFKNSGAPAQGGPKMKKAPFKNPVINIYTIDDQEYTIDPGAEGKQVGISGEHHIFDSYLIYLILGSEIDHIEVASSSTDVKDKYVLDKYEIHNNH